MPKLFKFNSISTLLFRAFNISSDWKLHDTEVLFLRNYFTNNGYPLDLFHSFLRNFLDKLHNCRPSVPSVPKQIMYINLPYYGYDSFKIRNELTRCFASAFPQVSFRFIFTNAYTIRSFFRYKDRVPKELCSNIVYKFNCSSCNAGYIGSSIRNLKIRVCEHKGISCRSLLPLSRPSCSEIREHSIALGHIFNLDDFEVLLTSNDVMSLRLAESLFIHDYKPSLNSYESAMKLYTHYSSSLAWFYF